VEVLQQSSPCQHPHFYSDAEFTCFAVKNITTAHITARKLTLAPDERAPDGGGFPEPSAENQDEDWPEELVNGENLTYGY
jgi:hypothetical protein